jgi:hypothetical protein
VWDLVRGMAMLAARRCATGDTTTTRLTRARLTAITDLTGSQVGYLSAPARGSAGDGVGGDAALGVASTGAGSDVMASDAALGAMVSDAALRAVERGSEAARQTVSTAAVASEDLAAEGSADPAVAVSTAAVGSTVVAAVVSMAAAVEGSTVVVADMAAADTGDSGTSRNSEAFSRVKTNGWQRCQPFCSCPGKCKPSGQCEPRCKMATSANPGRTSQ